MDLSRRRTPQSRNIMLVAATCLMLGVAAPAYSSDRTDMSAVRHLKNRTIFSDESPRAKLSIRGNLRFIGAQQINIHGNSQAEQYVFAGFDRKNIVDKFYLIQFEHFLPTNRMAYDYDTMQTTQVDDFQFRYDVKSFSGLGTLLREDQGSDGQALERLIERKHLVLPRNTVLVRMFHLPSADRRTELMILYGEALPQNTDVPLRNGGVSLNTESPGSAEKFLAHARQGLVIRKR